MSSPNILSKVNPVDVIAPELADSDKLKFQPFKSPKLSVDPSSIAVFNSLINPAVEVSQYISSFDSTGLVSYTAKFITLSPVLAVTTPSSAGVDNLAINGSEDI